MQDILEHMGFNGGILLLSTSAVVLGLVLVVVVQAVRLSSMRKKWAQLMSGSDGSNLEKLLHDHLVHTETTKTRLDESSTRLESLETKMESAKRYVGMVKFDAFEDVGGSQSFSLAVYDEKGDGVVMTSQVGRTDCRFYAKEIRGGKSDRDLSVEEQQAVEIAVRSRSKVASG